MTDLELLQRYAQQRDQQAFQELVRRHLDWVYSSALRQVRDAHLADDVTQAVFLALSQQAGKLSRGVVLTAWLFQVTRRASAMALRSEGRRRKHERQAAIMTLEVEQEMTEQQWQQVAEVLDELVAMLGEKDRQSILLRFYQRKSFAELGETLGVGESAARMRVTRAIEKLRSLCRRRGLSLGSSALAAGLLTHTTQTAPAGTATAVAALAATQTSASATVISIAKGAAKMMAWGKAKLVAAVVAAVVLCGTGTVVINVLLADGMKPQSKNAAPATQPAGAFGPIIEVVVNDLDEGRGQEFLDFETGELHDFSRDKPKQERVTWLKAQVFDLAADHARNRWALGAMGGDLQSVQDLKLWDEGKIEQLREALDQPPAMDVSKQEEATYHILPQELQPPLTFVFETAQGSIGIMRIVEFLQNPSAVRIQYQIAERGAATQPVVKATPKDVVMAALQAALAGDEEALLSCFAALTPEQELTLRQVVRGMAARNELKKAVIAKFGEDAGGMLSNMGIKESDIANAEQGIGRHADFTEHATVDLREAGPGMMSLEKVKGEWKIRSDSLQNVNTGFVSNLEQKVPLIRKMAADVSAGKYQTPQDVQQALQELLMR